MKLTVEKSSLSGRALIPASKSHTIRAVTIASLAEGESRISNPLSSADTLAAVDACRAFGAEVQSNGDWLIKGVGGKPNIPDDVIDVRNSGTTLYIAMGAASLVNGRTVFTGDYQIRNRPAQPLIDALNALGAEVYSTRDNGKPPIVVRGPLRGGAIELDGSKTSQYLTSLLICCPLAGGDTEIKVHNLIERPYVEMTLGWLAEQGIELEREGFEVFRVPGRQSYRAFEKQAPGDWSSATFFLCAAAITGSDLTLAGLDINDTQGDKAVVEMLRKMGADIRLDGSDVTIRANQLRGAEFDLNATPDALPALAVTACFAKGVTRLVNVRQARLKETDRIRVMREELTKMGGLVRELPDGLEITGGRILPAEVHGWDDHRIVMAMAIAGLACDGRTRVDTAEAVSVTFPNFVDLMRSVGGRIEVRS
ncbi:MAG: 3-phosphoshikimate 1-carboxyvinyltransferase [Armatimonadota bacterium]|nr:3-phosphoshikimate 1-carboxyvinyltransferase [Armatimonadota bacterium]